jgi:hypothetical protein
LGNPDANGHHLQFWSVNMIFGYLIVGATLGFIAAAVSLFMGFSVMVALGAYVVIGSCAVLVTAILVSLRSRA